MKHLPVRAYRRRPPLLRVAVFGAAIVINAGCSAGVEDDRSTAVTAPTPSPTIVDGSMCPPAPTEWHLAPDAGCLSSTSGTFEASEDAQSFLVYARVDEEGYPVAWHVRITRADRPPLDEVVHVGSLASYPVVLGAEDADRQGLDEAFVRLVTHTYHSGVTHEVGIFGVRRGELFRVRADGEPLLFQVGGVSVFGEGAECRDVDADGTPEFLLLRVDGVTNDFQEWVVRTYGWRGRSLHLLDREVGRMAKTGYQDPLLWRFYSLRCFTFQPPFPYARG